jgi:hypothetical protein
MYQSLVTLLGFGLAVSAKAIDINVGEMGSLKFEPNSTTADMGDT